jgi:hypothetical protein
MQSIQKKDLIYLICPVRNASYNDRAFLENYVKNLEINGNQVHYPPRDVNQQDSSGLRILSEHRDAMKKSRFVHAYWNPQSQGSYFDFGMAFMSCKLPWQIINVNELDKNNLDSFQSFLLTHSLMNSPPLSGEIREINRTYEDYACSLSISDLVGIHYNGLNNRFLFELGMIFMSERPLQVINRDFLEKSRTPNKSFENFLLSLDDLYGH